MHRHITLGDTVYFGFVANTLSGAADDGATPLYDVRLCGAAASAAPVLSGTPTLLTHANYGDGAHEIAIAATSGNGFASGNTYLVYATLTVDGVTPGSCIGSFTIDPIPADIKAINGDAQAAANLEGSTEQIILATVDTVTNTHTPTATEFQCDDITAAKTDHYKGRVVVFRTGALAGQLAEITGYSLVGGIGQFTVNGLTDEPVNNDTLVIL